MFVYRYFRSKSTFEAIVINIELHNNRHKTFEFIVVRLKRR